MLLPLGTETTEQLGGDCSVAKEKWRSTEAYLILNGAIYSLTLMPLWMMQKGLLAVTLILFEKDPINEPLGLPAIFSK